MQTFQAGGPRPPRCLMISAESAVSRPSPLTWVAARARTRRPAAKGGQLRGRRSRAGPGAEVERRGQSLSERRRLPRQSLMNRWNSVTGIR